MLAVFFGNDTVKVRMRALEFAEAEGRDIPLQMIEGDAYEHGMLEALASAVSLFGGRSTYVIEGPAVNEAFFEAIVKNAPLLRDSAHRFVVIEGALLAEPKKRLTEYAEVSEEYKAVASERFNTFSLADALAKRDRKLLWLLWHQALLAGISAEEIAGVLWWQLKTLRLAYITSSAVEAGLKDFPYKKAKNALGKFKDGDLERLSRTLLALLHESRLGRQDVGTSLERWILKV